MATLGCVPSGSVWKADDGRGKAVGGGGGNIMLMSRRSDRSLSPPSFFGVVNMVCNMQSWAEQGVKTPSRSNDCDADAADAEDGRAGTEDGDATGCTITPLPSCTDLRRDTADCRAFLDASDAVEDNAN